jgi:large conductance mechanosensitive channel
MKGFKDFLLRGNLIELAVAFIMAAAFTAVIMATVDLLMDLVGKSGGTPNFSSYDPGGVAVGVWLTAVVSFVVTAAVVYFAIVMPYTKAKELLRKDAHEEVSAAPEDVVLLTEIRDLLRDRQGQA